MSSRRDGYKVSGVLASRQTEGAPAAPTEFPTAPTGPVLLAIPPAAPAPAAATLPVAKDQVHSAEWELVDGQVVELDPDLIDDSPFQGEAEEGQRYDPAGISELAQTIASEGQLSPIKVRRIGKRFELIAGHRRLRAVRMIKRKILAIIYTLDDKSAERAVMVDNEGRQEKTDYQRAKLYRRALDQAYAKTQNDVAAMFATKAALVSRRLKMLTLPPQILALLETTPNLLSLTTADILLSLVAQYPDHLDIIAQAAARQSEPGATAASIKPWVAQMIAAKSLSAPSQSKANSKDMNTRVITDASKRSAYTARLKGRVITLRVHSDEVDASTVLERVSEFLERSVTPETLKTESQ